MPNFHDDDMMDHLEEDDDFYDDDEELAQNAEAFESNWLFDDPEEIDDDDALDHSDSFEDVFPKLCMVCGEPLPNCVCLTDDFED